MNLKSRTLSFLVPLLAAAAVTFGGSAFAGAGLVGVTISSTEPSPTNVSPIPITFTFDEDVQNFTQGDITPTNGALSNFQTVSAAVYTVDVTPAAEGTVMVAIAEGAAQAVSDGDDSEADSFSIDYDLSPTFTIAIAQAGDTLKVTVEFNEDVTGFDASDLTIGNGTLANFTPVSATLYTFDIVSLTGSPVTVEVADMAAMDLVGNQTSADTAAFSVPSVPDLRIGDKSNPGKHKGDNNYRKVRHKDKDIARTAKYYLSLENDGGATDSFTCRSKKQRSFKVTYKAIGGGGNVTAKMMTRGFVLSLEPGEIKKVKGIVRKTSSRTTFKDKIQMLSNRSSAKDSGIVTLKFRKPAAGANGIVPGTVGGTPLP
ncbi:MAG: hypothetical protein CMO55_07065 [Verrucomicrobiales bacterium]|nr:hypothetical protein [Verrucomicrobiales bacterium]